FPDQKQENVDNIQVSYYETGKGVPLVLLHGWPQTSFIWRKIIPALQKDHRIIAVELPGMGNSNAAKSADTLTVARFLKTFLDQINIDHFHLVAHDIGAWVAVTFALEFEQSLKTLSVLDAGIPGLIPDEIFSPVNAKKIW
ncbi:alpha/beta fold hydrolase, partial [Mucilaginibacter limnophilus]